jgi:hypothetical protein
MLGVQLILHTSLLTFMAKTPRFKAYQIVYEWGIERSYPSPPSPGLSNEEIHLNNALKYVDGLRGSLMRFFLRFYPE